MTQEVILKIRDLTKIYTLDNGEEVTACQQINLDLYKGQTLGIIGESGCGKTTLARLLMQLTPATSGQVIYQGQDLFVLTGEDLRQSRRHLQLVFQNSGAVFNPRMTVLEIVCEPLMNYQLLKSKDKRQKAIELLTLVELPTDLLDRYPHELSGGQQQRLAIARALSLEPEIIIFDEATCALDVSVQQRICQLLKSIQKQKDLTYLFISHDLALVDAFCDQVAVMYLGHLVELIESGRLSQRAQHPYTKALLQATYELEQLQRQRQILTGHSPSRPFLATGCPLVSRCPKAQWQCDNLTPQLTEVAPGHYVACPYTQLDEEVINDSLAKPLSKTKD